MNHQKPVRTTGPVTASTTGPPAPRSQGCSPPWMPTSGWHLPGSIPPGCRWPGSTARRSVPWARAWTRAVFHRVADATVRSLLTRVAEVLARPRDPADTVPGTGTGGSAARRTAPGTP